MIAHPKNIHFIGVCGTAMASVAVALKERGYNISGSDSNVYPPMSTFLAERGIILSSGYSPENVKSNPDLVVVGNAISRGNPELEEVLDRGFYYLSLPEVVKEFFLRNRKNLVVTGTHGKTTTTSLLTWILESAGKKPSYLIGGIPKNLGQGASFREESEHVVLEGDEYDTAFFDKRSKFLHYLPEIALINNIEFDHADIYENLDAIKLTFKRLVNIVPRKGLIVANGDDANVRDVVQKAIAPVLFVGCSEKSQVKISNAQFFAECSTFSLGAADFKISLPGIFNIRNAAMAITAARHLGISDAEIKKAVESFEGVKRRQEIRAQVNGITFIDDFGHHPTAIRETLTALRQKYIGSRLWVFFEPRSNTTRRAVFQNELPEALALADGIFVSQVAKLEQLPENDRLNPEKVMQDIRGKGKVAFYLPSVKEIVLEAKSQLRSGDVAVIFSNGGFDGIHEKLVAALS
jgi:UDP-N-acetylmuramate: L-alanyl-gamma-D-glutamyl-meso-diaminopimelate ligase